MKRLIFVSSLLFALSAQAALPEWLTAVNGKSSEFEGANCFSLPLMKVTGKAEIRYAATEELTHWLKSKYCKKLEDPSKKQEGDIVVFYAGSANDDDEDHAFIYMDESQAFSKNGYSSDAPYLIQDLKGILDLYGFSKDDWKENKCMTDSGFTSSCQKRARIYRCETAGAEMTYSADAQAMLKKVEQVDKKALQYLRAGELYEYERSELDSQLYELKDRAAGVRESSSGDKAFMWGAVETRIESSRQVIMDLNRED